MSQESFQNFLKKTYEPALYDAQQRLEHHQRVAKWLEWILIVLSAITTILLSISSFFKEVPITPLIAICSTFVTAIAAAMKSLNPREGWAFYQELTSDLEAENYWYDFGEEYRQSPDKDALFIKRILDRLKKAHQERPHMTVLPRSSATKKS